MQQEYTQAERRYSALDEELTRGYVYNLEVHASQRERVGHYRKTEQAKHEKVSNTMLSHCVESAVVAGCGVRRLRRFDGCVCRCIIRYIFFSGITIMA